jgi:glyoxylase-like metal-dependent hydrolase (beta-lactamase superfamily II)/8-oxo-dGTP pyrophosphatase MutT (NUDIX family)
MRTGIRVVSHIARAASVLLARSQSKPEYLAVERGSHLRFLGGFHAFPGGKVVPEDSRTPLHSAGPCVHVEADRLMAAARELFEETGVLLARTGDGQYAATGAKLDYFRRKMLEENLPFEHVLARLNLTVEADDFQLLGNLVTPPFVPYRFDTAFFFARLPECQTVQIWPGELSGGDWHTAQQAVSEWYSGQRLLSPPTVAILEALVTVPLDQAVARLRNLFAHQAGSTHPPIYVAPQVRLLPLFTDTLPPTTHTNAYVVGNQQVYIFDPGTALPAEQAVLFQALDDHVASGRALTAIVLTHHHPDHIGAAASCAERYRIPIYSHAFTQKKLAGKVVVHRLLADGDRLELGTTPDGRSSWHLQAVETPGHAGGHLAFWDPYYRTLLAGDMVSTISSVVIAPPEGDLEIYLTSLNKLKELKSKLLLPSHGGPSAAPERVLDQCLAHRKQREEQLLATLDSTPRTVRELTEALYKGLAPKMMRFAELQLLAGLYKLRNEGRVTSTGDDVWLAVRLASGDEKVRGQ